MPRKTYSARLNGWGEIIHLLTRGGGKDSQRGIGWRRKRRRRTRPRPGRRKRETTLIRVFIFEYLSPCFILVLVSAGLWATLLYRCLGLSSEVCRWIHFLTNIFMRRSVVLLNQQHSRVFEGFTGVSLSSINPNHHLLARPLSHHDNCFTTNSWSVWSRKRKSCSGKTAYQKIRGGRHNR